nr:hypothetical protein [Bacilli bacterium]
EQVVENAPIEEMSRDKENKPFSLFRTLATAIVLSSLVTIAALIYLLTQSAPQGEGRIPFILSFAIPFGVLGVAFGAMGIIGINGVEKPSTRMALLISGIGCFLMEATAGVFGIVSFSNVTIGVCMIGLGLCVLGITALSFFNRKEA